MPDSFLGTIELLVSKLGLAKDMVFAPRIMKNVYAAAAKAYIYLETLRKLR